MNRLIGAGRTSSPSGPRPRWLLPALIALVLVLLAGTVLSATGLAGALTGGSASTVQARFTRTVGLYPRDEVRILGVRVGSVQQVQAEADGVLVTLRLDPGVTVPADAAAVIVAPSLVSGRYVQLTPAYRGGPALADGAQIPADRTAVPVEWDEITRALDDFSASLGPDGESDQSGPLGRALDVAAGNLDGRGASARRTLQDLSAAVTSLSNSRGDIFTTVRQLAAFTRMLREVDADLRQFVANTAELSAAVDAHSDDLRTALERLSVLLPEVEKYLQTERPLLRESLRDLTRTSDLVVTNRQNVADVLQLAPNSLANLYQIYDPRTRSTTGALALPFLPSSMEQVLCYLIQRNRLAPSCAVLEPLSPLLRQNGTVSASSGGSRGTAQLFVPDRGTQE